MRLEYRVDRRPDQETEGRAVAQRPARAAAMRRHQGGPERTELQQLTSLPPRCAWDEATPPPVVGALPRGLLGVPDDEIDCRLGRIASLYIGQGEQCQRADECRDKDTQGVKNAEVRTRVTKT